MQVLIAILLTCARWLATLVWSAVALVVANNIYAATAPGSVIANQALLHYTDTITGETKEVVSNQSTITVAPYADFSIQSRHDLQVVAGRAIDFPHQLSNDGNVSDAYEFSLNVDGALAHPALVRDLNSNGVADVNEPELTGALQLAAGEHADLVVTTRLLNNVRAGELFEVSITVSNSSGAEEVVNNTVAAVAGMALSLLKSSSLGCHAVLFPGDQIVHEIDIVNTGASAVSGLHLLLDGKRTSGVVVEQQMSSGLAFSAFNYNAVDQPGEAVVRLVGVAENSWLTLDAWDGTSPVHSAGIFYVDGSLPPQSGDHFQLLTVVDDSEKSMALVSSYASVDTNGDRIPDFESNRTCHQHALPAAAKSALAELRFLEPAPAVRNRGGVADFQSGTDFVEASHYSLSSREAAGYQVQHEGVYLELSLISDLGQSSNIQYDRNNQRFIEARLESSVTGDHVIVLLLETDADGVFRSVAPVMLSDNEHADGAYCPARPDATTILAPGYQVTSGTCVLASGSADELQATYLDAGFGFAIAGASLVNPQGLVFNAQTGLPVAGAIVRFRVAATDLPVTDRMTGLPFEVTTGTQGYYPMPRLDPLNQYYVDVESPAPHVFPSAVSASQLPTFNVGQASYGRDGFRGTGSGSFSVVLGEEITPIDIPLDSDINDVFLVAEKNVLSSEVEVGGIASYSISVKNLDTRALSSVFLIDTPPYGYRYVPLSSTFNGQTLPDPEMSEQGELRFDLGTFEPGQTANVHYSLRVSAAAVDSDGINKVTAIAVTADNARIVSPESRVGITVKREGVLSDRASLFGKIYVDQNCNATHDAAEWPVGGVRLYLQDGTYTVSDADGAYSLYGLAPGTHVLKVDRYTLPDGLRLEPVDVSQAADPYSRFVDLLPGDFYRADFAAVCPDAADDQLLAEIRARNAMINGHWLLREAVQFSANEEQPADNSEQRIRSIDGDLSNGIVQGPVAEEDGSFSASVSPEVVRKIQASQSPVVEALPDPKKLVSSITATQAKSGTWVWPDDEISTRGRFMAVIRDGIEPTLFVNGKAVPSSQIGERLANRREKAQIVAWYGVELDAGENQLQIKGTGPFGNERVLAEGLFKKPSSGASIRLHTETDTIQADGGKSTMPVKIEIVDEFGYPALGVYFVTLSSSEGGWVEQDIQSAEPGVQVRVSNGERVVHFVSSSTSAEVELVARTGEFEDSTLIRQVTESRPLVAVGLVEAGVSLFDDQFGESGPGSPLVPSDGGMRFSSRAALFAKGRIKDRFNLTLSYDSDKDGNTQLMRDINPSAHYPIHGDASIRGFDAQSRSKLYVKIEENRNSLMWGDFLTDSDSDHEDLARSRRALTGFNSVVDSDYGRFRFYASRQEDLHQTEEFAGNGSAMLYRLNTYPIVANSEVVELITRSRDNPGIVIARSRLSRFGDYTIDPVLGFLTFSSVIPTVDDQQNPVFVQVSYDLASNGSKYWVNGLRYDSTISDDIKLGFSHSHDAHSQHGVSRTGAYVSLHPGERTRISVSAAGSSAADGGRGRAGRVLVEHGWDGNANTTFTYARADEKFVNSGASIAPGRVEARLNHRQAITRETSVVVEALHSESLENDESRTTMGARIESRLRKWLVRAGLRGITHEDLTGKDDFITAILGADRQFVLGDKAGQFHAELEQDTGRGSRHRVSVGGKLQVHEHARIYSNYELSNSLLALAAVSSNQRTEVLTLGVESEVMPATRMYSEYRMRGAFDSRDFETASGIRGDYEIKPDLKISPSVEVIRSDAGSDSIAASVAVADTRNINSRRLIRLEARRTAFSDYLGVRASYAARINSDWTSVFTENLSYQDNDVGEDTLRHSLVAGVSRRPKLNNRHHMLLMYNWKEEYGLTPGRRRSAHVISTHQNFKLSNGSLLSGRLGGKREKLSITDQISTGFTVLADVRLNFDLHRRVNVDLHGGVLATDGFAEVRYSAGAGVYYVVNRNARIGVGYNLGGFSDEDLDAEEYHAHGLRLGFQYKFDEDSLKWME